MANTLAKERLREAAWTCIYIIGTAEMAKQTKGGGFLTTLVGAMEMRRRFLHGILAQIQWKRLFLAGRLGHAME